MSAMSLRARRVEKTWGRRRLPGPFRGGAEQGPIGEIVFDDERAASAPLLIKYLFTSEHLSVQVHPDDEAARRAGFPRGKDEAWVVIDADEGASIATGVKQVISHVELREAALDGNIVDLLDWQPVAVGDVFYSPAGTIHAIGAGVSVIEVQQNLDLTYRLYDYGRPRELHLDQGLGVARRSPGDCRQATSPIQRNRDCLSSGPAFQVERLGEGSGLVPASPEQPVWLIPLKGESELEGQVMYPGEVWLLDEPQRLRLSAEASVLMASQRPITEPYWNSPADD